MPRIADRLPENVAGDLYVDRSCIDCGTCRRLAPEVFAAGRDVSYVAEQPRDAGGALRAYMALLACPVGAIGAAPRADLRPARDALPETVAPDVLQCGYASDRTAGAAAWLLLRPEGNVLVDAPRFARPLVERIAALGGLRTIVLTRGAHLGDAEAFARRFDAERVGHRAELEGRVDRVVDGDTALADDLRLFCAPGQSPGSVAVLWRDAFLFSGDLFAGDGKGGFVAEARHCGHSWAAQRASVERIGALGFTHLFPSHGLPWEGGAAERARSIADLLAAMQRTDAPAVPEPRGVRRRPSAPTVEKDASARPGGTAAKSGGSRGREARGRKGAKPGAVASDARRPETGAPTSAATGGRAVLRRASAERPAREAEGDPSAAGAVGRRLPSLR